MAVIDLPTIMVFRRWNYRFAFAPFLPCRHENRHTAPAFLPTLFLRTVKRFWKAPRGCTIVYTCTRAAPPEPAV